MDEIISAATEMAHRPDLLPWVVFVAVVAVAYRERGLIRDYFVSRTDAQREAKTQSAILVEVLRNNTAALDNNTAALESVKADRGETRRMLEHHEELSAARDAQTYEVVTRVEQRLHKNGELLGLIEDRTSSS